MPDLNLTMPVAEARAFVDGATRMAARRMTELLVECEDLEERQARWRFEYFLREYADTVALCKATILADEVARL